MQKPKLDVMVALLCYAGNGGVATVLPDIAVWLAKTFSKMEKDERVGRVAVKRAGDIPLTMIRNSLVKQAKDEGFDVLIMIDSDNVPDLYDGCRAEAKPFWDTSFDFLYERSLRMLPTVVCSPYCGPPPHPTRGGEENCYVFYASRQESDDGDPDFDGGVRFEAYSREHAAIMRGIQSIAAGPTGCIMYSLDAFDLMPVHQMTKEKILHDYAAGLITIERAKALLAMDSWFYYEFTDGYQTHKASTEDVTNTREIQMAGIQKHGEPVVFCNWDAWAGHYKPKCVGAPMPLRIEQVSSLFAEAVRNDISVHEEATEFDFTGDEDTFDDVPDGRGPEEYDDLAPMQEQRGSDRRLRHAFEDYAPRAPAAEEEHVEDEFEEADDELNIPHTPGRRMGKMFADPTIPEEHCQDIRLIAENYEVNRCAVIGDKSGELCEAMTWAPTAMVFAVDPGPMWDYYNTVGRAKVSGEVEEDPIAVANGIDAMELDGVVIHISEFDKYGGRKVLGHWFRKHLALGGVMVLVADAEHTIEKMAEFAEGIGLAHKPYHLENGKVVVLQKISSRAPA